MPFEKFEKLLSEKLGKTVTAEHYRKIADMYYPTLCGDIWGVVQQLSNEELILMEDYDFMCILGVSIYENNMKMLFRLLPLQPLIKGRLKEHERAMVICEWEQLPKKVDIFRWYIACCKELDYSRTISLVLNRMGDLYYVKVLLANGACLSEIFVPNGFEISRDLVQFKKGVNQCRDIIVTLLGLKKRNHILHLKNLDRFLIKEILAVEIWSTREEWQ